MPSERLRSSSTRSSSGSRSAGERTCRLRLRFAQAPDELLGLTDGQLLADHRIEDPVLQFDGQTAERPAMALGQAPVGDRGLDAGREIEESERVRDGGASLADAMSRRRPG